MLYNLKLALRDRAAPSREPAEGDGDGGAAHTTEGGAGGDSGVAGEVGGQDDKNGEEKDEDDDIDSNVFALQLETESLA